MHDLLAALTLMFWPVIPLFWIPLHIGAGFFRKIGFAAYLLPLFTWMPLAIFIFKHSPFLLRFKMSAPAPSVIIGWSLLLSGTLLHIWTARLLGLRGIIGVPEILGSVKKELTTEGPFSVIRHPTYLAHTLMFSGVFLITGVLSVGVVAVADFIVVNSVIIPLEEKELTDRFGEAYTSYKKNVPAKVFPVFFRK